MSKKAEPTGQFLNLTRARTNLTHSKSYMLLVLPNKQAIARSGYVSNNEDPQRPRPKNAKFIDENVVIKVVVAIFSTTSVVICCDPLLQQGLVALTISNTNIMAPVKRKIVLTKETTHTKIQKRPRTRTCRKKNENSTTTLLEELASEAVSSSK
ncbi:hypothetical protein H5410_012915 [Solanum commersonii]|uniref:Uncharacterized protein n=1 Tax=Solanum commersonii TaxID=4109 RepID=A0A9J6ATP2_SOLCO|nr:hypothetical protein H5410_012915 [Solanum commersonii]